jgi:hypothetical protein
LEPNGPPPAAPLPSDLAVGSCSYTNADNIIIIIVLATGFPAADFSTAEQDVTHPEGFGTPTGTQTFIPQSGLGDQAVAYSYSITPTATNSVSYEEGTIAIQGTNLVSVQVLGSAYVPTIPQVANTLTAALLT